MAGIWLPSAELTPSGRPVLQPNEIESAFVSSVDLESDEDLPPLKSGLLILTTHRILWIPPSESSSSSTASAIPLSSVTHIFPPKKSIKNIFSTPRVRLQLSIQSQSLILTLVFRASKFDPDSFYTKLWESWRGRAWENDVSTSHTNESKDFSVSRTKPSSSVSMGVGVSGILRREQEMWENTDKTLHDAFQDLNALMTKAKDMVLLAEKMRLKLLSTHSSAPLGNDHDHPVSNQEMQDWLLSIGIASPVTKQSAGALYHQQLSRQLADFVKLPLQRAGGMLALIDVYCLFNRARGTELISPEDLLQACAIWEKIDVPVMLRKFDSGVMIIQNKSHSDEEVFSRIRSLVLKPDALRIGITPSDAAMTLGIAPAMAKEHLLTAESKGLLCRDISPEGFRFYINLFIEINLNEIHLVKDHGVYSSWVSAASASG